MRREHNEWSVLPSGYTPLQYIEGTGTQYINTGYYPCNDTWIEYVAMQTWTYNYNQSQTFFGVSDGTWDINGFTCSTYKNGTYSFDNAYGDGFSKFVTPLNTLITINLDKTGGYIDGVRKWNCSAYTKPTRNIRPLLFFAANYNTVTEYGKHRCYGAVIKENGVLQRDFVPALRTLDSKPGLYDLVGGTFYANAGSGQFNYA